MVTKKNFKIWLYEHAVNCWILNWIFLIIIAAVIIVGLIIAPKTLLLYIIISAIGLGMFFAWIFVWGWYSVWFRYLAYGVAQLISRVKKVLRNTFMQIFIVLTLVSWGWVQRKIIFGESTELFPEILRLSSAVKILIITTLVFIIKKFYFLRKRIFIADFKNNTGRTEPFIDGIGSMILNEMIRLSKLLRDIDEAQPNQEIQVMESEVDIHGIGDDFIEMIGPEASVEIQGIGKIPIRAIFNFFKKLVHGPILTGSVHMKGNNFVLIACMHGGHFKGSWEITVDNLKEIHKFPTSDTEQLIELTNLLVCRIFTDISRGVSPRWQAMKYYTEGLWLYRETLRTEEKRIQNLIDAKNAFSDAIRNDSQFVQCFYNFGIIYEKIGSNDAAKAAFRKALEVDFDNHHCYYQLARIYNNEEDFLEADWFCKQACAIFPNHPEYWNLAGVIGYNELKKTEKTKNRAMKKPGNDHKNPLPIDKKIVQQFAVAAILAWKDLCKAILSGKKIEKKRDIAWLCIRNLAVITGKTISYWSRFLFKQALFLKPDNNDVYFELGKYYYRKGKGEQKGKLKKSYKAFARIFEDNKEVNALFSYWAFYLNVSAQLKDKLKIKDEDIDNRYRHFLDALAEATIHIKKKDPDKTLLDIYEDYNTLVSTELAKIKSYENGLIKIFLEQLSNLYDEEKTTDIINWKCDAKAEIKKQESTVSENFFKWIESQLFISAGIKLEEEDKDDFTSLNDVEKYYKPLKEEHPVEIKRLGLNSYLADEYLKRERYCKAFAYAREAARLTPYNQEVRYIIGRIYIALNDFDQGIKELEIGLNIEQPNPNYIKKYLKEIGEAYKKKGDNSQEYKKRSDAFEKAITYFTQYLNILNDKSSKDEEDKADLYNDYEKKKEEKSPKEENKLEDNDYINCLAEVHFKLGSVYRELKKYDEALSHLEIAWQIVEACKKDDKDSKILLYLAEIYRTYIESGSFYPVIQIFKEIEDEVDQYRKDKKFASLLAEIDIYGMLSWVECAVSVSQINHRFEEVYPRKKIVEIKEKIESMKEEKYKSNKQRLLALYHECLGRYYFKQGKMEEAENEFETSLQFMPNPRVYLYLSEFYLREASESKIGRKPMLLEKAHNACKLCRKNDLRLQYENELSNLEKKIHDASTH